MKFEKVSLDELNSDVSEAKTFFKGEYDENKKGRFIALLNEQYERLELPSRSTENSAGYDFHSPFSVAIPVFGKVRFPLGIRCVDMPKNVVLLIFNRSSLSLKQRITIDNAVGVIDSDFKSDIWIQLTNNTDKVIVINAGAKVCQGIFFNYVLCDGDSASGKRKGGIGSTGK